MSLTTACPPYLDRSLASADRATDRVLRLSLEEKVNQLCSAFGMEKANR